jgi:hypothetical protein
MQAMKYVKKDQNNSPISTASPTRLDMKTTLNDFKYQIYVS